MKLLRAIREHELLHKSHYADCPYGTLLRVKGHCAHCGDPALCLGPHDEGCCKECWLEITTGLVPSQQYLSNAPHKPKNVSIKSTQRMPRDTEVDYFGHSWEDD